MKKTIVSLLALVFLYSCTPTPQEVPNTFTDNRDGKVYKTVTIGEQVWMAENLAYLPSVVGPATESDTDPYYYVYDYDGTEVAAAKATTNYTTYGVLYNWPTALTACPEGWHLPSDAEWKQLEMYLGMSEEEADKRGERGTDEGGKLKEVGTTHWETPNTGATNSSGFTALPGGQRDWFHGNFGYIGHYAVWWCSTEDYVNNDVYRRLYYNDSYVTRYSPRKSEGLSVRCVQGSVLPIVTTGDVSDVGTNLATCASNVIADGGAAVTARGVCWSTSENPSTSDIKTTDGEGIGDFTSNLTGLSPYTIYYVRAYATNSVGTVYGEQKMFRTSNNDVESEWALFCGATGEKTWVWDDTLPGAWGNGGYKGCAAPCWWVVPVSDINDQAPGEGAGASMTFTIAGARLIKNFNDGTTVQGSFTFDMSKITLDDGGNVWAIGKLNTENVTVLCGKSPNESNAPIYNYDILQLTDDNMVLSYPEPGAGSWGTAWFWMFKRQ